MKWSFTVSIVCQEDICRAGLQCLIEKFDDCTIKSISSSAGDILEIVSTSRPDILLCEVEDRKYFAETIHKIITAAPSVRFVMISDKADVDSATRFLSAGAAGYLSLSASSQELHDALRQVGQGDTYVSPAIANKVIAAMREETLRLNHRRENNLSHREEQIARLLCEGKTNREIAVRLGLREKTIKHYMSQMMQKMHLRNRLEVAMALQHLLPLQEAGRVPN